MSKEASLSAQSCDGIRLQIPVTPSIHTQSVVMATPRMSNSSPNPFPGMDLEWCPGCAQSEFGEKSRPNFVGCWVGLHCGKFPVALRAGRNGSLHLWRSLSDL